MDLLRAGLQWDRWKEWQLRIVVSTTGVFMKQSQKEFGKRTRLEGNGLPQCERNVVDMTVRGSFSIYQDSMDRARHNKEHTLEPEVLA
jgi:regulator of sigma D